MKKLLAFVVLLFVVAGAAVAWMYVRVNQPYRGFEGEEQFVELPQGSGSLAIGQRLVDGGVVRDLSTFRTALWMSGKGRHLKAGEYRFDRPLTPFVVDHHHLAAAGERQPAAALVLDRRHVAIDDLAVADRFEVAGLVDLRRTAMWNVRIVSWVPGSPIDCAAITPTASPMFTGVPRARSRP